MLAWIGFAALLAAGGGPAAISLGFPVRCQIGVDCQIQNYVDHDPSAAAPDYRCGGRTYNGHDGTDIRLQDMRAEARGVDVLAAADGQVLRTRDNVQDVSIRQAGLAAVKGEECGNGLVIAHADGWETQYCHMAQGSLRVHPGQQVKAGEPLGHVGLSGATEFPHLHITVRRQGTVVDPFSPDPARAHSCGLAGATLWNTSLAAALAYRPRVVLEVGFADRAVTLDEVQSGQAGAAAPSAASPALVAYVQALGLQAGDRQDVVLKAPDGGTMLAQAEPGLEHDKAEYLLVFGRKRPPQGWPRGVYRASYVVRHEGKVVLARDFDLTL